MSYVEGTRGVCGDDNEENWRGDVETPVRVKG
jgi:hypothetical protein